MISSEIVLIISIVCLTLLGCVAMMFGFNGNLMGIIVAAIVTISSYLYAKTAMEKSE